MQLIVSGNTQENIPGSNARMEEIRLLITKRYLTLLYGKHNLNFPDRQSVSTFTTQISGTDRAGILEILREYGFYDMELAFSNTTSDQLNLFKSVFLIYSYVEEQKLEKTEQKNDKRLFDKLILEKRLPADASGVLYFIREAYLAEQYLPMLNKLIELKLLCRARLLGLPTTYTTYFTTLNHNSVSREVLTGDPGAPELIALWQMIQVDKRNKMYNSFNLST